jgi:hypothetical protein
MPLKALLHGQPILAPLLTDREWTELHFQRHHLMLPCCPEVAVQLRGGAGTRRVQHFSHTPLPTCQFRGETTVHLWAKVEIARACAEAGWTVDIEHVEANWRADVLAVRAQQRIAFEVQWSRQTLAQTLARQVRYRAAGVRGCWFFRYPPSELRRGEGGVLEARHDLPLFGLEAIREQGALRLRVGRETYGLGQVVGALLGRRIAFRTHRTFLGTQLLHLVFSTRSCAACGHRCTVYGIAAEQEMAPHAPCGARVLLWSGTRYHPDVAQVARRVYQTELGSTDIPLVTIEPGIGFRCPSCQAPIVPAGAAGRTPGERTAAVQVSVTHPLSDLWPHWCFPQEGDFCRELGAARAKTRLPLGVRDA